MTRKFGTAPFGVGQAADAKVNLDQVGGNAVDAPVAGRESVSIGDSVNLANRVRAFAPADATGADFALWVVAFNEVFNGATQDRLRSASAANLNAQSGLGAAVVAPPGQWSQSNFPAAGTKATVTQAAGAVGVRHIGQAMDYGYGATTALAAAAQRVVQLLDGAASLFTVSIPVPAATILATNNDAVEGRALVGTAATAMSASWDALQANLFESVALSGFDAS